MTLPRVYRPDAGAEALGITRRKLVELLKATGGAYTRKRSRARPWGRGRQDWGMTAAQVEDLLRALARRAPPPADAPPPVSLIDRKKRIRPTIRPGW